MRRELETSWQERVSAHAQAAFQTAVLADFTFPSGEKEDFLGTGDFRVKTTSSPRQREKVLASRQRSNRGQPNKPQVEQRRYRLGSEYSATPRLTSVGDLLGVIRQSPR